MAAGGGGEPSATVVGALSAALGQVRRTLQPVRDRVTEHGRLFAESSRVAAGQERRLRRGDVEALSPVFCQALAAQGPLVDGLGVVVAPGLLEDAPVWLEWWRASPRGRPVRLAVSFEATRPDSYLYSETEWFRVPSASGGVWMHGPYVDPGGANAHICTYTQPVVCPATGAFLGVAGADLRVGEVERAACRALAHVDRTAVLANLDGRVIASNDLRFRAGALLPAALAAALSERWTPGDGTRAGGVAVERDAELPWAVVAVAAASSTNP